MQPSETAHNTRPSFTPRHLLRVVAELARGDAAVLIGVPLLIAVGAILGIINLLALIHLVAVLIGG